MLYDFQVDKTHVFATDELEQELLNQLDNVEIDQDEEDREVEYLYVHNHTRTNWHKLSIDEILRKAQTLGNNSSPVKNADDGTHFFAKSDTWQSYQTSIQAQNQLIDQATESVRQMESEILNYTIPETPGMTSNVPATSVLPVSQYLSAEATESTAIHCPVHCIITCPIPCAIHCASSCSFAIETEKQRKHLEQEQKHEAESLLANAQTYVSEITARVHDENLQAIIPDPTISEVDRETTEERNKKDESSTETIQQANLPTYEEQQESFAQNLKSIEIQRADRETVVVKESKDSLEYVNKLEQRNTTCLDRQIHHQHTWNQQNQDQLAELTKAIEDEERLQEEHLSRIKSEQHERERIIREVVLMDEEDLLGRLYERELKDQKRELLEMNQVEVHQRHIEEQMKLFLEKEREARIKAEEEARIKEEKEKVRIEEEKRVKAEQEERRKADEEARIKAEEEARIKAEEEARIKAEEEARIKADEEARIKAAEEARIKAEEEARIKANEEARIKAEEAWIEEEAKMRALVEEKIKAEEEAKMKTSLNAKATIIQFAWLRCKQRRHSQITRAASAVQSLFRGFHVRRKITAALEMAKFVDPDDFNYEEIDVDEFLQRPEELTDDEVEDIEASRAQLEETKVGWVAEEEELDAFTTPPVAIEQSSVRQGGWDHNAVDTGLQTMWATKTNRMKEIEQEEAVLYEHEYTEGRSDTARSTCVSEKAELENEWNCSNPTLASLLWKRKQRQKKLKTATQRRQKEADPIYRVKRFQKNKARTTASPNELQKNQQASGESNKTIATWTIGNGTKKKHKKVKVPSLVERLRKRCSAASNS